MHTYQLKLDKFTSIESAEEISINCSRFLYSSSGFVYAAKFSDGAVKVGKSRSIKQRMKSLESARGCKLTSFFCMVTGEYSSAEARSHKFLSKHKIRGEWFDCTMEDAISAIIKSTTTHDIPTPDEFIIAKHKAEKKIEEALDRMHGANGYNKQTTNHRDCVSDLLLRLISEYRCSEQKYIKALHFAHSELVMLDPENEMYASLLDVTERLIDCDKSTEIH